MFQENEESKNASDSDNDDDGKSADKKEKNPHVAITVKSEKSNKCSPKEFCNGITRYMGVCCVLVAAWFMKILDMLTKVQKINNFNQKN